jgi:hypothetical protein
MGEPPSDQSECECRSPAAGSRARDRPGGQRATVLRLQGRQPLRQLAAAAAVITFAVLAPTPGIVGDGPGLDAGPDLVLAQRQDRRRGVAVGPDLVGLLAAALEQEPDPAQGRHRSAVVLLRHGSNPMRRWGRIGAGQFWSTARGWAFLQVRLRETQAAFTDRPQGGARSHGVSSTWGRGCSQVYPQRCPQGIRPGHCRGPRALRTFPPQTRPPGPSEEIRKGKAGLHRRTRGLVSVCRGDAARTCSCTGRYDGSSGLGTRAGASPWPRGCLPGGPSVASVWGYRVLAGTDHPVAQEVAVRRGFIGPEGHPPRRGGCARTESGAVDPPRTPVKSQRDDRLVVGATGSHIKRGAPAPPPYPLRGHPLDHVLDPPLAHEVGPVRPRNGGHERRYPSGPPTTASSPVL